MITVLIGTFTNSILNTNQFKNGVHIIRDDLYPILSRLIH